MNVRIKFDELRKIINNPESNSEWQSSLTKLQAVYLILDLNTGQQYIGTTYGANGLWQRWESYVKGDGTGGNFALVELRDKNKYFFNFLQFSILEVLSKTADQDYCTERESVWKKKLGTRAHGLNKN